MDLFALPLHEAEADMIFGSSALTEPAPSFPRVYDCSSFDLTRQLKLLQIVLRVQVQRGLWPHMHIQGNFCSSAGITSVEDNTLCHSNFHYVWCFLTLYRLTSELPLLSLFLIKPVLDTLD